MTKHFQFGRLPLIVFGERTISQLPGLIKRYGKEVLLVTGRSSFGNSSSAVKFYEAVKSENIDINKLVIQGEPSDSIIDEAVAVYRVNPPRVVVAIGGGSVMDAGKAISAMIPVQGKIIDFLEGTGTRDHPGIKIPFIAIPTTSGTGSEATKNAVISRVGKNGFKKSLRHDNFVPDIALIDPELTISCPQNITAASGMDCFTQLVEAYLSNKANEYTNALALEGLKALKLSLINAYIDGNDVEARAGMSFAALTSGICLANAGLGVIHGFASSIGGLYNIPHGVVCGTLMAVSNEITVKRLREIYGSEPFLSKYSVLARIFLEGNDSRNEIDSFIEYLHGLTEKLHLPGLKTAGINENDLKKIASATDCKNNPVKLTTGDLCEILQRRYI
ncbi:MAG TPA: iron-containing alcohol dehydrogenase [Bacteroidales bacterium]|nr:iron-containing alcohol dehydrogenase [Bacteroidales bacterium]HQM70551.1 iron-containing alcohol dehydrogenase [Bacteroidales bacterium]